MLQDFLKTAVTLAVNGKLAELIQFIQITFELMNRPQAVLTLGKPQDKPKS